ncbi:phenylalanine--tRNA ligase subunit alpha [Parvivirga hydrogeniphila]|uniref:phenylalanine--tRNA ligase subunit alpha n=1 Tax=Parvivirga hydrogeniphila TaxID=2939460 RepID=UPI002B26A265|nr:phenylalanine--tRNA ligase subunit alpha [Parvivirga hydrogeniphila]
MGIAERIVELKDEALERIATANDLETLEAVRVAYLGKKGELTAVLRGLGELPAEQRPAVGKVSNEARDAIEQALLERRAVLEREALERRIAAEAIDVTLPGRRRPLGHQHIIHQIVDEIVDVFVGLGYRIAEGPEVELDYYNFTALNHPPEHPARAATDTFYVRDLSADAPSGPIESEVLLRTHTSPVQVRVMEKQRPPIYVLAPGKVFRRDVADPSHLPQFTQIEGLVVDEGITFGDLKGTLEHFVREIFGPERRVRLRPHFFPFTEPSAEVDVSCAMCGGEGCRSCGGEGWLEVLGCGMVDPNVFRYVGIDPERYSGFAFGMGAERIAALKHGIPDLRLLIEGDMRFLRQF